MRRRPAFRLIRRRGSGRQTPSGRRRHPRRCRCLLGVRGDPDQGRHRRRCAMNWGDPHEGKGKRPSHLAITAGERDGMTPRRSGLPFVLALFLVSSSASDAHQSGCHRWHSCPSDRGTYVCGDTGHCSQCRDNEYCKLGKPRHQRSVKPKELPTTPPGSAPLPKGTQS